MSNIKPIQINPELFKISNNNQKNKTLKKKPPPGVKPNVLKKDLLARIKSHRANKMKESSDLDTSTSNHSDNNNLSNLDDEDHKIDKIDKVDTRIKKDNLEMPISVEPNTNKISKIHNINNDDDFLQSIDFLKTLSKRKQNKFNKNNNFPLEKTTEGDLEKNDGSPSYGCLKNGTLPTFRELHNKTIKKPDSNDNFDLNDHSSKNYSSNNNIKNRKNVTFKYNLGKKHKIVSVLIKNASTRKKISSEHSRLKESKLNDMKNYLKRHNLLKSGSKCPPDVIKKMYEQALLGGDIRNTNKNSIVHNYLAE